MYLLLDKIAINLVPTPDLIKLVPLVQGWGETWAADGRRDKERYNVGNPILICFGPILQKLDDAIYLKTYES